MKTQEMVEKFGADLIEEFFNALCETDLNLLPDIVLTDMAKNIMTKTQYTAFLIGTLVEFKKRWK